MAERIETGSTDLTVTSPPYDNLRTYKGYIFDFETIAQQLWRVTKPGGVVVWVVADATINGSETGTSFRQALRFMEIGFNLHDTMIYEVAGTGAKGSHKAYWQAFEFMFVFSKGNPKTVNRIADKRNITRNLSGQTLRNPEANRDEELYRTKPVGIRTNIWRYLPGNNGDDQTAHPAQYPEALARDHIASWSNPGDLVLDPMCGSGTTIKMAVLAQRRAIGIDIAQEYIELTRQRVDEARSQLHLFPLASNDGFQPTAGAGRSASLFDQSDDQPSTGGG
jgi:site-specific DNA-methyltransferase (adenine-specific)